MLPVCKRDGRHSALLMFRDWVLITRGQLLLFCFLRLTALEHHMLRKGILQTQAGSAVAGADGDRDGSETSEGTGI